METTFENLIVRLNVVGYNDIDNFNRLRASAIEFLKRALPDNSSDAIKTIEGLEPQAMVGSAFWRANGANSLPVWKSALATFIGVIEAKMELFESLQGNFLYTKDGDIAALKLINDGQQKQFEQEKKQINEAHKEEVSRLIDTQNVLLASNQKLISNIELAKKELSQSQLKVKRFNIGYWVALLTTLLAGIALGNIHFDSVKNSMKDTIDTLNIQNTKLKDSVNKLKIELLPVGKTR